MKQLTAFEILIRSSPAARPSRCGYILLLLISLVSDRI